MINFIITIIFFTSLISYQIQSKENYPLPAENDTTKFEQVFIIGLHGDMRSALNFLDTTDDAVLTERQAGMKQKFYSRFRLLDEESKFIAEDSTVKKLNEIYIHYWRAALMDNPGLEEHDKRLMKTVSEFLRENYEKVKDYPEKDLNENFPDYLKEFLSSKGIYAAAGKTGMFYDLLLHAKETEVIYEVDTPEDTINVKVVFMENIISNGWEDYATFGKYYPGGWATSDALYCIKESYDLESENFLVSYLKHEGKHFADYKRFPKLTGADLEYRAKLVELSYARENLYKLIRFFTLNSNYDRQNPHGFANFCVIRDLSRKAFGVELASDTEKWESLGHEAINALAISLLKKNTDDLKSAGAETVSEFIK